MTTEYKVKVRILLKPRWHKDAPQIKVSGGHEIYNYVLYDERWFDFDFTTCQSTETISVEFLNKIDRDTVPKQDLDKAVMIQAVEFFGISDPKFSWAGVYEPKYPEPWASEQLNQGVVLKQHLSPHTYLSWNGKWTLTFDVPVFTWMHKLQNLGWIYS
jgi:hypothetical protein